MTTRLAVGNFLLVVLWNEVSISNGFRDIMPQTPCSHRHKLSRHDMYSYVKYKYIIILICHPQFVYSLCYFYWAPMKNKWFSVS